MSSSRRHTPAKTLGRRAPAETPPPGPGSLRLPWGLPDALGATIALSMVCWWPWATSTTSLLSMTILAVAMLACLPWIVARWRDGFRPRGLGWIPVGAAGGLVAWAIVSLAFSGVPWPVGLYGWTGRQDGVLMLIGVAVLLAGAASLAREEFDRVFTWLLLGGAVLVLESMAQLAGWTGFRTSAIPGVWAAMGNPNFLAAMCGLLSAIALGRVVDRRFTTWQRAATGALLAGLVVTAGLTQSTQGPVTVAVALATVLALRLLQWRSPYRVWIATGLGLGSVAVIAATVLGLLGTGPMTRLWASESTGFRKTFWDTAWRITNGLPVFGTGPDGLARYIGEYRTEQYIVEQGPGDYLNAAHNVALQYGATTGYAGLVLWLALVISAGILVVITAWRWTGAPWVIASVGGVLAVYVAQALISIDDLRLKEVGWLAIGLVVAAAAADRAGRSRSRVTPATWVLSGVLGLVGLLVCLPPLTAVWQASGVQTVEEAVASATNPQNPWDRRLELLTSIGGVYDLQQTWEVGQRVGAIDPRGPGQAASLAELAILAGDPAQALVLGELAVSSDPLNPRSWIAYSLVLARTGDDAGAQQALDRAAQLNQVRPLPDWESLLQAYERNTAE